MKKIISIDIDDAEVNMQLASDAVDEKGVCMLTVGSVLTSGSISGLKKRNIKEISIYKKEILTPEQSRQMIISIKQELDHSFEHLQGFSEMNKLKHIFHEFRTKDLIENNE
ncbi:MAG: hypothetical protein OQL09_09215 [Gammaproteobacteria bacterium]|nr:hypothetical protein [Gammaproteobacteria bacterium]